MIKKPVVDKTTGITTTAQVVAAGDRGEGAQGDRAMTAVVATNVGLKSKRMAEKVVVDGSTRKTTAAAEGRGEEAKGA